MHLVFLFFRIYPYVAIPLCFIFLDLGRHALRARNKKSIYSFWAIAAMIFISIILWFVNRGDLYSDQWVRSFLE